jgi:hypothetical protein
MDVIWANSQKMQSDYMPTLHAQIALTRHNPSKAIEILHAAAPYELGAYNPKAVSRLLYIPSTSETKRI